MRCLVWSATNNSDVHSLYTSSFHESPGCNMHTFCMHFCMQTTCEFTCELNRKCMQIRMQNTCLCAYFWFTWSSLCKCVHLIFEQLWNQRQIRLNTMSRAISDGSLCRSLRIFYSTQNQRQTGWNVSSDRQQTTIAENCKPEIGRHENSRPNLIFWRYKSVWDDSRNTHWKNEHYTYIQPLPNY